MKETLHIKNFGPIKEVKLELGKVNVLIGEQGTGKSAIVRLIHLFHNQEFLFSFKNEELRKLYVDELGFFFKKMHLLRIHHYHAAHLNF